MEQGFDGKYTIVREYVKGKKMDNFERLKKEGLNPLKREYIIDKINLRRVQNPSRHGPGAGCC